MKDTISTFFTTSTIYDVVLPKEIIEKLNNITFAKKAGVVANKRKDKVMLLLCDMISKHQSYNRKHNKNLKSIPIHNKKWIEIAGMYDYYQEIPSLLISNGIIKPYLNYEGEHSYCIGEFARGYYIPDELMTGNDVRVKLSKPMVVEADVSEQQEWLVESYKDLSFPSLDEVIEESFNQLYKKTKKNQTIIPHWVYVLLDDKAPYIDIEEHIEQFERLMDAGLQEPRYQSNGRMIDSISCLPSWIRDNMIKIEDQKLIKCDFKALHHNLIPTIIEAEINKRNEKIEYNKSKDNNNNIQIERDIDILDMNTYDNTIYTYNDTRIFIPEHEMKWWNDNCTGDGHSGIARALLKMEGNENPSDEEVKQTREYVKLESLSHYNTTKFSMMYGSDKEMNRMAKLFMLNCRTIWTLIRDTKKGPYGHCNTSRLLTRLESKIIQQAIKELKEKNIKCVYVHDCLMVKDGNQYECRDIMNRIVKDMNINTYVDIE